MNPFDQFSDTLGAALPGHVDASSSSASLAPQQEHRPQFNLMAQPPVEKKPVMNSSSMMPPQYGSGGGGFGQPGMYSYGQQQPPQSMRNMMLAPSNSINMGGFMGSSAPNLSVNGGPPPAGGAMMGALVPSSQQSNPYALGPTASIAAAATGSSPFGAPQNNYSPFGGPPQSQQQSQMVSIDPFSSGGGASVAPSLPPSSSAVAHADPWGAASSVAPTSHALVPSTAPPSSDPFGIFGGDASVVVGGGQSVISASPYQQSSVPVQQQQFQQQPPSVVVEDDPWNVFGDSSPAPAPSSQQQQQLLLDEGDLFDGGIGAAATRANQEANKAASSSEPQTASSSSTRKKGELPPGGEWYDAKIFTPTLGVMFFKPKELVDSLFLQTDKEMVDALDERPVVAFIVEGSSARSAGVELGHVLLKVNGIDVKNPKEASRLIKEGPRPLPLLFYVPETQIVVAEGEHMVKYNTKETGAPNSAKDWKPKYVVIGGIIAQPWMMMMYRSKVSLTKSERKEREV